jgi:hypothetical protein
MSALCPSYACGCCGIHEVVPLNANNFHTYNFLESSSLALFQLLQLSQTEIDDYLQLQRNYNTQNYHRIFSIYLAPNGHYYHIHPELVQNYTILICNDCDINLRKYEKPKLSIATGVDYGNFRRVFDATMRLTPVELAIISLVRMFCFVLKVIITNNYLG